MKLQKNTKKHKKVVITALEQRTLITEHATKPELFFFQSKKYRFEKKRFMPNMFEKTQKSCFFSSGRNA